MPKKIGLGVKRTKNTKAWWQLKTGWSTSEFESRRLAVISKIREKWPDKKMLNGRDGPDRRATHVKRQISNQLRPLVLAWNDQNWPAGAEDADRIVQQLRFYVSWALYLNKSFKPPPLDTGTPTANSDADALGDLDLDPSKSVPSPTVSAPQQPPYWSETEDDEDTTKSLAHSTTTIHGPTLTKQPETSLQFDWDNVEVNIDATQIGFGNIWLPMIDLKSDPRQQPYHWADFSLDQLYTQFSTEIGTNVDPSTCEFVYATDADNFVFFRQGAYRIALKRFSQTLPRSNILALRIRSRRTYSAAFITRLAGQAAKLSSHQQNPTNQKAARVQDTSTLMHNPEPVNAHASIQLRGLGREMENTQSSDSNGHPPINADATVAVLDLDDDTDEPLDVAPPAKRQRPNTSRSGTKHIASPTTRNRNPAYPTTTTLDNVITPDFYAMKGGAGSASNQNKDAAPRAFPPIKTRSPHQDRQAEAILFSETEPSTDDEVWNIKLESNGNPK